MKKRSKKRPPRRFSRSPSPEMNRYLSTLVALERPLEAEELEAAMGNLDKIDKEWSHLLTVKLHHPDSAVRAVVAQLLRHRNDRSILNDLQKVFDTPGLPSSIKLEVAALLNDFGLTFDLDHLKAMLEEPEREAEELLKTIRHSLHKGFRFDFLNEELLRASDKALVIAIRKLAAEPDPRAVDFLLFLKEYQRGPVRRAARKALRTFRKAGIEVGKHFTLEMVDLPPEMAGEEPSYSVDEQLSADQVTERAARLIEAAKRLGARQQYEQAKEKGREALAYHERAIELQPDNRGLYEAAHEAAQALRDFDRAVGYLEQMIPRFPDKEQICLEIAKTFIISLSQEQADPSPQFIQQRNRQIEEALKRSIGYCPTAMAYLLLGELREGRGDERGALKAYQKAVEAEPNNPNALGKLGNAWGSRGEAQKAIACFERELELAPDRAMAYYNLGLSCRIDGQYERAIDAYRRAIELKPTYADAYNNLGNIYLSQGRYHEAIELYQRALRYHPSDALFHYNLGACYELVGEQKKAKAELAQARKLDPTLERRMRRAAPGGSVQLQDGIHSTVAIPRGDHRA